MMCLLSYQEGDDALPYLSECGPSCSCSYSCLGRLTQRGCVQRLLLVKSPQGEGKGWSVIAGDTILAGTFVCQV